VVGRVELQLKARPPPGGFGGGGALVFDLHRRAALLRPATPAAALAPSLALVVLVVVVVLVALDAVALPPRQRAGQRVVLRVAGYGSRRVHGLRLRFTVGS
jgi:hypothetical protein